MNATCNVYSHTHRRRTRLDAVGSIRLRGCHEGGDDGDDGQHRDDANGEGRRIAALMDGASRSCRRFSGPARGPAPLEQRLEVVAERWITAMWNERRRAKAASVCAKAAWRGPTGLASREVVSGRRRIHGARLPPKWEMHTASAGPQPCVLCMDGAVQLTGAPRAEKTTMASMTAINANAAITRAGERGNVFMVKSEGLGRARRLGVVRRSAGAGCALGSGTNGKGIRIGADENS